MSLKAFHIFFVCVSILLAFGFAVWELYAYAQEGGLGNVVLGIGSLVAGIGLVGYLRAVIRKLRQFDAP